MLKSKNCFINSIFINLLAFVLVSSCSKDRQVVGEFLIEKKKENIYRHELRKEARLRSYAISEKIPIDLQYNLIKEVFFRRILLKDALAQKLDQEQSYLLYKKMREEESVRTFYRRHWYQQQEKNGYDFIDYSHILIKNGDFQKLKDKTSGLDVPSEEKNFAKIMLIRKQLLNKEVTFEQAAAQHSMDSLSAGNGGAMSYSHIYLMDPSIALAVASLIKVPQIKVARLNQNARLWSAASQQASVIEEVYANQLVEVIHEESSVKDENPGWIKIKTAFAQSGYLEAKLLNYEPVSTEISLPVRSHIGWHIVKVSATKKMRKDEYSEILSKTQLKAEKDAGQNIKTLADQYWQRITESSFRDFENSLFAKFGLIRNKASLNNPNWQKAEYAFDNGKIKIRSEEFLQILRWMAADRKLNFDDLLKSQDEINKILNSQLRHKIYYSLKGDLSAELVQKMQEKYAFDLENYLVQLYRNNNWYNQIETKEEDLRRKYQEYVERNQKQNDNNRKEALQSFTALQKELQRRVYFDKVNKIKFQREEMLLKTYQFQFMDKNLSESFL